MCHCLTSHPSRAKQCEVKGGEAGPCPGEKLSLLSRLGSHVFSLSLSHGGLQVVKWGRVVPKNDGHGRGHRTATQLQLLGSWHSRQRWRAIESCFFMDSQNSPSGTLGVRLCSSLSAKPTMLAIESLFPLSKDCPVSLIPSWGAERTPWRSKFTYNKRAKQKSPSCCSRKPHPENCCYNDSSYWGQLWDFTQLKNCRLSATS